MITVTETEVFLISFMFWENDEHINELARMHHIFTYTFQCDLNVSTNRKLGTAALINLATPTAPLVG